MIMPLTEPKSKPKLSYGQNLSGSTDGLGITPVLKLSNLQNGKVIAKQCDFHKNIMIPVIDDDDDDIKDAKTSSSTVLLLKFVALLAVILSAIVAYLVVKSANQQQRPKNCNEGMKCPPTTNTCLTLKPCSNGGLCHVKPGSYKCDCKLGYAGNNCEKVIELGGSVMFKGTGYAEFSRYFLSFGEGESQEDGVVIRVTIRTTENKGLIFWHGQDDFTNSSKVDYVALALKKGNLEFRYQTDGVETRILSPERINDGYSHNITVLRYRRNGQLLIDNAGSSVNVKTGNPFSWPMKADGNIFIGGIPHPDITTGGRYTKNFKGCISDIYLQDKGPFRIPDDTSGGLNGYKCNE